MIALALSHYSQTTEEGAHIAEATGDTLLEGGVGTWDLLNGPAVAMAIDPRNGVVARPRYVFHMPKRTNEFRSLLVDFRNRCSTSSRVLESLPSTVLGRLVPTAALARSLPLLSCFGLSRATVLTIEREITIIVDYAVTTVTLTRRRTSSFNDTKAALLVASHACLWPL